MVNKPGLGDGLWGLGLVLGLGTLGVEDLN